MTLDEAAVGDVVIVEELCSSGSIHRRLLDLGIMEQTQIQPVLSSPTKDMRAYLVKGCVIALRRQESRNILVRRRENHIV